MIDNLFLLAVGAFGWGLSLCTYRLFARSNGWPMGALQADLPMIPALLGGIAVLAALLFAAARGWNDGGWVILVFGLLLALFWTGFLRVGSQVSLFLAPFCAALLLLGWMAGFGAFGLRERAWATETPSETLNRKKSQAEDLLRERYGPGTERPAESGPSRP